MAQEWIQGAGKEYIPPEREAYARVRFQVRKQWLLWGRRQAKEVEKEIITPPQARTNFSSGRQ